MTKQQLVSFFSTLLVVVLVGLAVVGSSYYSFKYNDEASIQLAIEASECAPCVVYAEE